MDRSIYLAHIAGDGREQTVADHLEGTARRSAAFAADFGSERFGRLVGLAHDVGKNSAAFQKRLLHDGPKVDHATAGAIECAKINAAMSACCVIGHHGGLPDFGSPETDMPGDATFIGRLTKGMQNRSLTYESNGRLPAVPPEPDFQGDDYRRSLWTRMLYSCLVDADYLDTEEFMSGGSVQRGGYETLPTLWERLEKHISGFYPPKGELNRLRCRILERCTEAASNPKGIYTLTVPTGGGKTLASLAFALRHAMQNGMRRIIYVIPYTSIIEQNAQVFRSILGENNVIEHHSGACFDSDVEINGEKSLQRLASENWDAPVIVTTAVQFFESIYANRSSKCRKLHNIANSIVIFDEAQMLPTNHLRPCVGAIANLAADFGVTAVLCTATQPVLNDLIQSFAPAIHVQEICPDTAQLYERFRRVRFRDIGMRSNAALAEELLNQPQVLCIVNSRAKAQEIYQELAGEGSFHLSTLMYPAHRQAVLQTVRQRLSEGLPCRVISTSLIEAGVDVDFPAVYREMAGLDSILQAAGRCNRNGKRDAEQSVVTIFAGGTPAPILFQQNIDAATMALKDGRDPGDPESIRRYFTFYRKIKGNSLDKGETVKHLREGVAGRLLPFRTVAENFHMIDDDSMTVYIPRGDGAELCQALLSGTAGREVYRQAGRYSVSVFNKHYHALLSAGDVQPLDAESGVLTNTTLYSEDSGLSLVADTGKAEFI